MILINFYLYFYLYTGMQKNGTCPKKVTHCKKNVTHKLINSLNIKLYNFYLNMIHFILIF